MKVDLLLLFGAALLIGTFIGALCRHTRIIPPLTGYLLTGVIFGSVGFNWLTDTEWHNIQLLFDLCLGLVVYEMARQIDWRWLRADRSLIQTTIVDGVLTCAAVFTLLILFDFSPSASIVIGIVAVQTSPAIVLLVTRQIEAKGYITRRLLTLTGLNNVLALCLLAIVLPILKPEASAFEVVKLLARYLVGPLLIALATHSLHLLLARRTDGQSHDALLLAIGSVAVTVGVALTLALSVPLALLWLGILARNAHFHYRIPQPDLNAFMQPFMLVLFVLAGARLQFGGEFWVLLIVIGIIVLRATISASANWLFTREHLLTIPQCIALGAGLAPMSELTVSIADSVLQVAPDLKQSIAPVISQLVAIQHLLAPIGMTLALRWIGEAHKNSERAPS